MRPPPLFRRALSTRCFSSRRTSRRTINITKTVQNLQYEPTGGIVRRVVSNISGDPIIGEDHTKLKNITPVHQHRLIPEARHHIIKRSIPGAFDDGPPRLRIRKAYGYVPEEKSMTAPGHQTFVSEEAAAMAAPKKSGKSKKLSLASHYVDRPDVTTTYVDTHCHLFSSLQLMRNSLQDETIPQDAVNTFVQTLLPKEVIACIDIHCDIPLTNYHEMASTLEWPEHFKYYFAMGAHPHVAPLYTDEIHNKILAAMSHPLCVAWGECGLDYFKNAPSTHSTQQLIFKRQLLSAVSLSKPIIIHTRDADADTLSCLRECVPKDHRIHIHCFTSGRELAETILKEYPNAFIGLTGALTYSGNEHVYGMLVDGSLPLERLLLETDAPYMVPKGAFTWFQKERPEEKKARPVVSHAGMIPFTAERVLEGVNEGRRERGEKEAMLAEALEVTRQNAGRMYGIEV